MRLYFKQNFLSLLDSFEIFDEEGEMIYRVSNKLAFGHVLKIYDMNDEQVGTVKQVILTFLPKFEFYIKDEYIGSLKKEFTLLKSKYNMDFNGWQIEGNVTGWDYRITDADGDLIAIISKDLFHLTDRYNIDVNDEKDALSVLMFVLAIDAEKCTNAGAAGAH